MSSLLIFSKSKVPISSSFNSISTSCGFLTREVTINFKNSIASILIISKKINYLLRSRIFFKLSEY